MYDHTLFYHERKHFCRYILQAFRAREILKQHINISKIALELMVNKGLRWWKKKNTLNSKNFEKNKIKSRFMIYTGFENILVPEDNGKQNNEYSYINKYQKHVKKIWNIKKLVVMVINKYALMINLVNLLSLT